MNKIIYDYSLLKGKIAEKSLTQAQMSELLGISAVSLNSKLKNKTEFKQSEIIKISNCLGIAMNDIPSYFFVKKLVKTQV